VVPGPQCLRRGEIAGLRWADIDLDTGTLSIARNSVQVGATTVLENEPKTQLSRRTLPLDTGLIAVLKRASAWQAQDKLALSVDYADSDYVACNEAGQPYTPGAPTFRATCDTDNPSLITANTA
jgi:integrase